MKKSEEVIVGIPSVSEQGSRRTFLARVGGAASVVAAGAMFNTDVAAGSEPAAPKPVATSSGPNAENPMSSASNGKGFWPNDARLAVSISLMFEGGGQPISGAGGPIPEPIDKGIPDLPTNAFFAYGYYEGIPRALNLFDKYKIKVFKLHDRKSH